MLVACTIVTEISVVAQVEVINVEQNQTDEQKNDYHFDEKKVHDSSDWKLVLQTSFLDLVQVGRALDRKLLHDHRVLTTGADPQPLLAVNSGWGHLNILLSVLYC